MSRVDTRSKGRRMKAKIKKWLILLAALGIVRLFANSAFSWTNELESQLDSISYYNLQVDAVMTDMYLYFDWLLDEKEAMKKASGEVEGE